MAEHDDGPPRNWVKFEEGEDGHPPIIEAVSPHANGGNKPAVIDAETVHVSLDRTRSRIPPDSISPTTSVHSSTVEQNQNANADTKVNIPSGAPLMVQNLHNVDLTERGNTRVGSLNNPAIRQGFANGDVIVTLLPVNTKWPWITPAQFRPELVPEELMAQGLTLTVEEYVHSMEMLTNDVRFNAYNMCYKRILISWILAAFIVLLALLFSGVTGLTLFGLGVMWLVLNAGAIFFCMWVKIKLNKNLEKCLARVNRHLLRHKIILGLDDRGKLSCHKVNLCFIYFDTTDCVKKLHEIIANEDNTTTSVEMNAEERRRREHFHQRMDIEDHDIIITGVTNTRLSRKQARAEILLLRYLQRWAKAYLRKHLSLSSEAGGNNIRPIPPRHCTSSYCPCQYVEEHLKYKPEGKCSWKKFFHIPNAYTS